MPTVLSLLCLLLLLLVAAQDFRYRAIYWWLCPLLAMLLIVKGLLVNGDKSYTLTVWLINIAIITLQLAVVWLYTLVRRKGAKQFLTRSFGLGDVLCLYALCFIAPAYPFVMLCCVAYILALAVALLLPKKFGTIPLAGWLAVAAVALIGFELVASRSVWEYNFLA